MSYLQAAWVAPERTGGRNDRKILNKALCTDDFGTLVYRCQYTKKLVFLDWCYIGPCIPQLSGTYICHSVGGLEAFKKSKTAFDESEANCNTCKHLQRLPHDKRDGLMRGICLNHPYKPEVKFHPDDWMGMSCYKHRNA